MKPADPQLKGHQNRKIAMFWLAGCLILGRHYAASPHCVLTCYPTSPKVDLTYIWEGETRYRLALPTWLRWTPVLGPNAERARRGPQTSLVNVVQPRGAYLRQEIHLPHKQQCCENANNKVILVLMLSEISVNN